MNTLMKTNKAVFFLRNAPLIDKKFNQIYQDAKKVKTQREIELGLKSLKDNTKAYE
jgi:hypothetical protein